MGAAVKRFYGSISVSLNNYLLPVSRRYNLGLKLCQRYHCICSQITKASYLSPVSTDFYVSFLYLNIYSFSINEKEL